MAEEKMDLLGITAIRKKSFQDLSGGQRQRVLLARALCSARKVLFMDEPVNGLDPGMTEELYALIKKLNRDEGLAMMMTSHDVERAAECATTILHVDVEPLFMGSPSVYMNEKLFCSESPGAKQCLV